MGDIPEGVLPRLEELERTVRNQATTIRRLEEDRLTSAEQIRALQEDNRKLSGLLTRARRELLAVRRELRIVKHEAQIDDLTSAFRLGTFTELLDSYIQDPPAMPANMDPTGKGSVLLFVDLIEFGAANKRFGHSEANRILRHLVNVLVDKKTIRLYDPITIGENDDTDPAIKKDGVGRFGGDEFLVFCGEVTETEGRKIAERVKQRCEEEPIVLTEAATGNHVEFRVRLHVAGVWWPTAHKPNAANVISIGGVIIDNAKKGRHLPDHISWRALTE